MSTTAAVVGGGPAGLMAAEVLAQAGLAVTVYDRMPTVGRKLQVAGRGGLNLTHSEPRARFLARYGTAEAFLTPAVDAFDADALRAWASELGQATFVGSSGRVFPETFRATALLRAWLARLAERGVTFETRRTWTGWDPDGRLAFADGSVAADVAVLALGGASWPRTGSDGAWVAAVEAAGVEVVPLRPANGGFTVDWTDAFVDRFAGEPLKDVAVHHDHATGRGDVVVTRRGIEGGPVYAIGASVRTALDRGAPATVALDLYPGAPDTEVLARLDRRRPKDSLANGLRRAGLAPVAIALLREVTANQVPTEAGALASLLHRVPVAVTAPFPIARAISTAGGVALAAVDDRLMLVARPGTFVAGEMLDWEAPTGGYLLQAAFSTGRAAAHGALAWLGTVPS